MSASPFFAHLAAEGVRASRTKNAFAPVQSFGLLFAIACFGAAYWMQADVRLRLGLVIAGLVSGALTFAAYFVLLFRNPDLLRSEDSSVRMRALDLADRQTGGIALTGADLVAIANPYSSGDQESR